MSAECDKCGSDLCMKGDTLEYFCEPCDLRKELAKAKADYSKALHNIAVMDKGIGLIKNDLALAKAGAAGLRAALEFYSDKDNYFETNLEGKTYKSEIFEDQGEIAWKALSSSGSEFLSAVRMAMDALLRIKNDYSEEGIEADSISKQCDEAIDALTKAGI